MSLNILNSEVHSLFDQFTDLIQGQSRLRAWEKEITIPHEVGQGSILRTRIRSGMEIVLTDVTYVQDMKLSIQEACPLFELSYCLNGDIYCEWDGKESYTRHCTGNVLFFEDELVYQEKKANVRHHMLEIRLSPQELFHYAADLAEKQKMESWLQQHKGNIDKYPDTPEIRRCVADMMNCTYNGALKRLYMESKAMELIALFGTAQGREAGNEKRFLNRDDLTSLEEARELVLRHFEQPLSIRDLAREVGLNEYKLKKGFRERFGMTVFDLVRKQRMERARYYMEVQRMNVGEAAVSVGYSNVSNFTAAFRKIYGYNPSEYLKMLSHREAKTE